MFRWAEEEESPMEMEVSPRSLDNGLLIF
jgi:hypothetical protein